ncbi:hypothetical protein [Patulibacter americanus]|uniref:hypothetical protein n=1 Tax=Patulibacter americanus TaxID=588672 RepID=UPI0003B41FF2|nr:hypothetical protein [Patulibacter americanus]
MRKSEKILSSVLVVGVLVGATSFGVYGAFSATTQNAGNEISTGTVQFTDNDAGAALYNLTAAKPGSSVSRCIKTTYTGTLPSAVRLRTSAASPGSLAQYIDVKITQGTSTSTTFPDCAGFTAAATGGTLFTGTLAAFGATHASYATGIATAPAGQTTWSTGTSVVYKIDATLQTTTPESGQGSSSGVHDFVWEARNN